MILVGLSMAFVTLLVVANIIAVKLIAVGGWVVPAGIVAYPFTFLVSDTIAELYGRKTAVRIVWLGFVFSLLMLALVYVAKVWPAAGFWDAQGEYDRILGSVPRIVLGSTVAYLISQHHDVIAFHIWRRVTRGRHLWLRNNASTVVSQAIDTLLFVSIAFGGTVSCQRAVEHDRYPVRRQSGYIRTGYAVGLRPSRGSPQVRRQDRDPGADLALGSARERRRRLTGCAPPPSWTSERAA